MAARHQARAAEGDRSVNLENHILQVLGAGQVGARPVTIGDLARQFGVSPVILLRAARQLVDEGRAAPWMVDVNGVPTLRGLRPLPVAAIADDRPQ
jgi:hypothetical protein